MPYINPGDYERAALEPSVPGELNYAITLKAIEYLTATELSSTHFYSQAKMLALGYLARVGLSYTNGNAVIGVLDCVGLELKRRMMDNPEADQLVENVIGELAALRDLIYETQLAPYEDQKIEENGDVYPAGIL